MKTIPPICSEPDNGVKYWRSLEQLADTPEFKTWAEREFPAGASELNDEVTRRDFVKIMSASFLLAGFGLTGCRRPEEKIYPFSRMPENYVHGVAQYYATSMPTRGSAIPLVVKSNEGRPTKIEGNAQHPDSNGGTDTFAQASILGLYDPDRAQRFVKGGNDVARAGAVDFLSAVSKQFSANGGEGLCFLAERSSSPSRDRLQILIGAKFPKARWFVYEPVDFDIHRQAASLAFVDPRPAPSSPSGPGLSPSYRFDQAKVILSLDCDFIGAEENNYRHIRGFAKGRKIEKPGDSMNRLYVIEALMTQTGMNADHRLRVAPSVVTQVAAQIAAEVIRQSGVAGGTEFLAGLERFGKPANVDPKWTSECARDLLANKGSSLIVAGHRQPLGVHVMANAINAALGNVGATVALQTVSEPASGSITELADALKASQVDTLVVLGGNPVYNAPADLDWAKTQRQAKTVIRLGYYEDETFGVSDWHLPAAHYLESWGDARTSDGTLVPVQPLIEPLFGGLTDLEVVALVAGVDKPSAYEVTRETFKGFAPGSDFEAVWKKFLHDGYLANSAAAAVIARFDWSKAAQAIATAGAVTEPGADKLEVVFHRDYSLDDGRWNNNGWLQEMPDPITKMTWDNAVLISRKTAVELGVKSNDIVEIQVNGRTVQGPVWIQPGQADYTLGLALGYGREKTGRIGRLYGKKVGFNAYAIRPSTSLHFATGVKRPVKTGETHKIICTQDHWSMEGRPIIREANLKQFVENPRFAESMNTEEAPSMQPLYPNPFDKLKLKAIHQWGMSIDLNACVGCSACVLACQSENNVPIVGREQVSRGREMQWLRIDRYYTSLPEKQGDKHTLANDDDQQKEAWIDDPQVINQPMLCQHCESAPCESVCPVNATVHDEEGLNLMVYNRCVGTRYCSNNCPYKVRRFNFFDYNKRPLDQLYKSPMVSTTDGEWEVKRWYKKPEAGYKPADEWELLKLVKNPDVSVRMRGVMEKCTFCVQRIEQAKIAQKVKAGASGDVEVRDGTIKTACQQACPAEAIVFGNIADPNSRVARLKAQERNYSVLDFLLTKPRLTYLARIRNPNPLMPDYYDSPLSTKEFSAKSGEGGGHSAGESHDLKAAPTQLEKGAP
ncbi:MAG: TAT-variant-translocated molybdopterin oxidoreductase [Verrucomicrobiota bacterium]